MEISQGGGVLEVPEHHGSDDDKAIKRLMSKSWRDLV
jgi:hypothetical protein